MTHKAYAQSIKVFPFAYNTPNILTGAALYTPVVGELLFDVWMEIDKAWDGATPFGDVGPFQAGDTGAGWWGWGTVGPIDMTSADGFILDSSTLKSQTTISGAFSYTPVPTD